MRIVYKNKDKIVLDEKSTTALTVLAIYFIGFFSTILYFFVATPEYFLSHSVRLVLYLLFACGLALLLAWFRFTYIELNKKTGVGTVKTVTILKSRTFTFNIKEMRKVLTTITFRHAKSETGIETVAALVLSLQKEGDEEVILNPISGAVSFDASIEKNRKDFILIGEELANFIGVECFTDIPIPQSLFKEKIKLAREEEARKDDNKMNGL